MKAGFESAQKKNEEKNEARRTYGRPRPLPAKLLFSQLASVFTTLQEKTQGYKITFLAFYLQQLPVENLEEYIGSFPFYVQRTKMSQKIKKKLY